MSRLRATLVALVVTFAVYAVIAWLLSGVAIPPDAPTAQSPWIRPFRVVATLGLLIASLLHGPHVLGQCLAAIILGAVLGAVFASTRQLLQ